MQDDLLANSALHSGDPEFPLLAQLLEDQLGRLPTSLRIAPGDPQFSHHATRSSALASYFRDGVQIADAVLQAANWYLPAASRPFALLDFDPGYGQATRFLQLHPANLQLTAAGTDADALNFLSSEFGIRTLPASQKPEAFQPGLQWDFIFAGSLFTRLPEVLFLRWLWKLYSVLRPGGVLMFGVNGEVLLPPGEVLSPEGVFFSGHAESGTAIVADSFVRNTIFAITGSPGHVRIPQGLAFTQDFYLLAKDGLNAAYMLFHYGPRGFVDSCRYTSAAHVHVTGWAVEPTPGEQIDHVEVSLNGKTKHSCSTIHPRLDVAASLGLSHHPPAVHSGWSCDVPIPPQAPDSTGIWLAVSAVSTSGRRTLLALSQPEAASQAPFAKASVDLPDAGRFSPGNTLLRGWILANDPALLEQLLLEGNLGPVPFSTHKRPDVSNPQAGLPAIGFEAFLPPAYLTQADPGLRFVTKSGLVLVHLETTVDLAPIGAAPHAT